MTTYVINDIDGDAVQQVASGTIDQIATLYPADHPVLALIGQAAANGTATATYEIDGEQYTTTVIATTEDDTPSVESVIPPACDRRYSFDAEKAEGTIEIETASGTAQVTAKLFVEGDGRGDWFINAMYVGHESIGGEPTDMEIAYALRAIETNDLGV